MESQLDGMNSFLTKPICNLFDSLVKSDFPYYIRLYVLCRAFKWSPQWALKRFRKLLNCSSDRCVTACSIEHYYSGFIVLSLFYYSKSIRFEIVWWWIMRTLLLNYNLLFIAIQILFQKTPVDGDNMRMLIWKCQTAIHRSNIFAYTYIYTWMGQKENETQNKIWCGIETWIFFIKVTHRKFFFLFFTFIFVIFVLHTYTHKDHDYYVLSILFFYFRNVSFFIWSIHICIRI